MNLLIGFTIWWALCCLVMIYRFVIDRTEKTDDALKVIEENLHDDAIWARVFTAIGMIFVILASPIIFATSVIVGIVHGVIKK